MVYFCLLIHSRSFLIPWPEGLKTDKTKMCVWHSWGLSPAIWEINIASCRRASICPELPSSSGSCPHNYTLVKVFWAPPTLCPFLAWCDGGKQAMRTHGEMSPVHWMLGLFAGGVCLLATSSLTSVNTQITFQNSFAQAHMLQTNQSRTDLISLHFTD